MTDYFILQHIIYSVDFHVHQRTTTVSYSGVQLGLLLLSGNTQPVLQ